MMNRLTEPTGPYRVGIERRDLADPYRKELSYPEGRLIPIQIYFPMEKGKHTLQPKLFEKRAAGNWPPLEVEVYGEQAELSLLVKGKHPVILLNHGDTVAMTDYAFIAEDLASNGYIVIAIQHQLKTDAEEPKFWKERSVSKYGRVIDNILYVFEWLKGRMDLSRVGLIGHSMGGNALLLFASRVSNVFKNKGLETLLPRDDARGVKECLIVLDTGGYPYPAHNRYPLFLLLSEERESYQRESGAEGEMRKIGHKVHYYKGSKHISFMDHGYVDPPNPIDPSEHYFNGTVEERKAFFDEVRKDIRDFLRENLC